MHKCTQAHYLQNKYHENEIKVILCYCVAVSTHQFVAYVALSLAVEINSVFLHTRQLLIISSEPKVGHHIALAPV